MDYITIIQGDDTNFLGDQFLVINFNTDIDLSGFTATFSLGDVTLTYGDLSGKNFEVILSDEITSNLALGKQYGELKLIDTEKRIRTVTSVIPFLVRKGVNEEIKFVNNSLEVSMNINDTVLDVVIETPGIARAEATRMMSYCNEAKLSAQNSANEAQNTLMQLNQDVDIFYENISNLNDIVSNAYDTCENNITALNNTKDSAIDEVETLGNEKITLATKQADVATEKAKETSDTHIQALSHIDTARQNSLAEMDEKNTDILENFENIRNTTILEFEEKRVDSINEINTTTIIGKECLTEIANKNLYKWNLFDIVKKDHILTFEEKQGLELLGTFVYKNGVPEEKYGYKDFYETCVDEYNNATEITITIGEQSFTGYKNPNGHIYYNISDKEIIDNIYSKTGIAWFYGIDIENERVFLPRNDYFFQNGNEKNVGNYIEAGLPDHSHNITAFYWDYPGIAEEARGNPDYGHNLSLKTANASQSNPIYGNSETVQPASTQLAVYMVVGNTLQKDAITNIIETTTSENDTIPLLSSKYDTAILDEGAFVRSQNSWLSGTLYKTAYARLENQLSASTPQIKVIKEEDMVLNEDYTDYFQVRETTKEFKLPIRTGKRVLAVKKKPTPNDTTWFNWYSDGWLEQGGLFPISASWVNRTIILPKPYLDNTYFVAVTTGHYNHTDTPCVAEKTTSSFHCQPYADNNGAGWFTCGYSRIPQLNEYTEPMNLYFKLSNAVQNLQLLNIQELLSVAKSKLDFDLGNCTKPYVVEIYKNGYSWYKKWSDGFIEQGGAICTANVGGWTNRTISLLQKYSSLDYMLITQGNWSDPISSSCYVSAKTIADFTVKHATNNIINPGAWYACGY